MYSVMGAIIAATMNIVRNLYPSITSLLDIPPKKCLEIITIIANKEIDSATIEAINK